jgi:chloramphenicol-sensitive protein RarD
MYINPTLQFVIALLVFNEPLSTIQLTSFMVIWLALIVYSISSWQGRVRRAA